MLNTEGVQNVFCKYLVLLIKKMVFIGLPQKKDQQ